MQVHLLKPCMQKLSKYLQNSSDILPATQSFTIVVDMAKGLFIVLEGGEGAGKSVQTARLAKRLHDEGYDVLATREPGGTHISEQIRTITHDTQNTNLEPTAEAYLMAAARAQHVREIILP